MASKTIVFIHGMFMTPLCWEHWVERFQAKGYTCSVADYKEFEGRVHFTIGQKGWEEVADYAAAWLVEKGV